MSRLAQLKNAAPWMTSAIARSSSPAERSSRTFTAVKAVGVSVSATDASMVARHCGSS